MYMKKHQHSESDQDGLWNSCISLGKIELLKQYKGEIRFSYSYYAFKSIPHSNDLTGKTFGDWFYVLDKGILLQQWNSIEEPNAQLVFLDAKTLQLKTLIKGIRSVNWDIRNIKGHKVPQLHVVLNKKDATTTTVKVYDVLV